MVGMNRQDLVNKLELTSRALAQDNMVPIFTCFCFDGKTVSAYNDSLGIIAPCKTNTAFAVEGKTLLGLLTNSGGEEVSFHQEGYEIVVKTGASTFKLPYHAKEEFLFKEPDNAWEFSIAISEIISGLEKCLTTASTDRTQPALMGVTLDDGVLYASDGDALTKMPVCPGEKRARYFLSNEFCEAVIKINTEAEGTLYLSRDWAKAELKGYTIYGRLQIGPDIDFEREIKNTLKTEPDYVPIPPELNAALSRARVVADAESKPTKFTVAKNRLHLNTESHLGVVSDTVEIEHPDVIALVSAELMQRQLKLTDEMAIFENCCCFRKDDLFVLMCNYG